MSYYGKTVCQGLRMLSFQISVNGEPLCTVSSEHVVSAISTLKGKATVGGAEPPQLNISGMTGPNTHVTWSERALTRGDKILIEVVDVPASALTPPSEVRELDPDFVESQQRAYYERVKAQYEPTSS